MTEPVETPAPPLADPNALVPALEAVLFASPDPLSTPALASVFGIDSGAPEDGEGGGPAAAPSMQILKQALEILAANTARDGRGIRLLEVAGGWQFLTREEHVPWVRKIAKTRAEERLSPAVIETLSVVAYKQPVTRAEVDAIRGAQSGPHIRTLMDKGMVRVAGRADLPGAPFTYGTTKLFLKHFGLKSVKDLPDPKELARLLAEQGRSPSRDAAEAS